MKRYILSGCSVFVGNLLLKYLSVTQGNILYRFPSLQRTASGSSRRKEYVGKWFDFVADMDKFFKEKKWQFRFSSFFTLMKKCFIVLFVVELVINGILFLLHSKTSSTERAMVIGLGAVNLFGVIVLNTLLK